MQELLRTISERLEISDARQPPIIHNQHQVGLGLPRVEEAELLSLATAHLEGDVPWFQWLEHSMGQMTWAQFKRAVQTRFGTLEEADACGTVSKLRKIGTVKEYLLQFERFNSQLNPALAKQCGCKITSTDQFKVTVRDGGVINSSGKCYNVPVNIQVLANRGKFNRLLLQGKQDFQLEDKLSSKEG
ncbi:hypothetical protein QYF36_000134 [Acer negundo]|nr:hypothetical protein QYF36_000134 [Acer negundo]